MPDANTRTTHSSPSRGCWCPRCTVSRSIVAVDLRCGSCAVSVLWPRDSDWAVVSFMHNRASGPNQAAGGSSLRSPSPAAKSLVVDQTGLTQEPPEPVFALSRMNSVLAMYPPTHCAIPISPPVDILEDSHGLRRQRRLQPAPYIVKSPILALLLTKRIPGILPPSSVSLMLAASHHICIHPVPSHPATIHVQKSNHSNRPPTRVSASRPRAQRHKPACTKNRHRNHGLQLIEKPTPQNQLFAHRDPATGPLHPARKKTFTGLLHNQSGL